MTVQNFQNDVIPMLLGASRSQELSAHKVILRHVLQDLESDRSDRAIETLNRVGETLQSSTLLDVARFLAVHRERLQVERNSTEWSELARELNETSTHWRQDVLAADLNQLFQYCLELRKDQTLATSRNDTKSRLSAVKQPILHDVSHRQSQRAVVHAHIPSPSVVQSPTMSPSSHGLETGPEDRVNHNAAIITFLLTLGIATFIWLIL